MSHEVNRIQDQEQATPLDTVCRVELLTSGTSSPKVQLPSTPHDLGCHMELGVFQTPQT